MLNQASDRLTIQIRSTTQGASGTVHTWIDLETIWGSVKPITANARANMGALHGNATHIISLREPTVNLVEFAKHRIISSIGVFELLEPPMQRTEDFTAIAKRVTYGSI